MAIKSFHMPVPIINYNLNFQNIIKSSNTILDINYQKEWRRISDLTGKGAEHLVQQFDKYISVLAESQHDTYTSPFEIVTRDMGKNLFIYRSALLGEVS